MTVAEYYACLAAWGLTKRRQAYDGGTLYVDREGQFTTVPNPESLTEEERFDILELVRLRLGIDHD